jgi:hypothetical protein
LFWFDDGRPGLRFRLIGFRLNGFGGAGGLGSIEGHDRNIFAWFGPEKPMYDRLERNGRTSQ